MDKQINNSKEQMKMNTPFRFGFRITALTVTIAAVLAACEKSENQPAREEQEPDRPEVVMLDVALTGSVADTNGKPLDNVLVSTGSLSVTTGSDGTFTLTKAATVDNRTLIRFTKDGYFTLIRSAVKDDEMIMHVVLRQQGNTAVSLQTSFNASQAGTLAVGGMKVEIPASTLVSPDGSTYTGNVNAHLLYLDPNDNDFAGTMPGGDLAAIRSDNTEAQLISYGMAGITLADDDGNPLQLKNGTSAQLTFPIPDGMGNNPPATIPLWSFNEERGVWTEETAATLHGNVYTGPATHFSWYNLDLPARSVTIRGAVTDCENNPIPYLRIIVGQMAAITNSKGEYSLFAPAGIPLAIMVRSGDYHNYSPQISHDLPENPPNTTVTQNISLPCTDQVEPEPEPGHGIPLRQASITYHLTGQTLIFTFDNYGRRVRVDQNYGTDQHSVVIFDDLEQRALLGAGATWMEATCTGEEAENEYKKYTYTSFFESIPGLSILDYETIAGKQCSVITYNTGDCYTKYGGWDGIIMLMEDCRSVAMIATNVSPDIPADAFTRTMNVF
jgi:hypothetical protein